MTCVSFIKTGILPTFYMYSRIYASAELAPLSSRQGEWPHHLITNIHGALVGVAVIHG